MLSDRTMRFMSSGSDIFVGDAGSGCASQSVTTLTTRGINSRRPSSAPSGIVSVSTAASAISAGVGTVGGVLLPTWQKRSNSASASSTIDTSIRLCIVCSWRYEGRMPPPYRSHRVRGGHMHVLLI